MRVLAVGNMYPPHSFGGYELVWRSAMRYLERHGHTTRVLTTDLDIGAADPSDPAVHRELRWYWRDHGHPRLPLRERLSLERWNSRALARHLAELDPDVVSWWPMGGMSLSMLAEVRRRGIPSVAFVHDDWLDYGRHADGWTGLFRFRLGRLAAVVERATRVPTRVDLATAARYVFVSETTRRRALEAAGALQSTAVAPSGIDPSFIDPAPQRDWSWSLLYVGRLDERKGVRTAVAALAQLPEATTLTLMGGWNEDEEATLRALADRLGVAGRTHFAGQRTREDVRAAYAEADVVLFPAIWEEPWGLVPLEAMARGRPVVATGRGGSGEYLRDGENALLFEAEDPTALAAAVRRLADDPALRDRLRRGGLDTAPRFTEDRFNEAVLREIVAAGG